MADKTTDQSDKIAARAKKWQEKYGQDTTKSNPIQVTIHRDYGACDECGHYEWGYFAVSLGGVEVARKGWSGHLGGDIQGPEHDIVEFVRELLVAVGVDADVQETGR